ncbi:MAG: ABC transporter ATP-binding protein [Lachnospiraceae bacterium]|nr:ABC transporter ATP-binding protein [Lachnospiraceae bacterium]MBQ7782254.1 ABC transporter ATP-binding protein [Lachnospiraceae bacterium]
MQDTVIKIDNLKKKYRLGLIGGGTLTADLQSWWAKVRKKEDPNLKIGEEAVEKKEFWALNGINLEVKKGETLGIIGANGAGKSTLLKVLSRVTAPTDGEVKIKGRISSMLEVGTGFHGELTGRENIYLNGAILGMSRKEVDAKMEDIIEFSECRKFIDTPVKRYSSGMYVKLAFAVAAHLDSEILVMDEVLAVGDMKFQEKCLGKMGDVADKEGRTVLYVSHNMNTIQQLCSRCIVLDKGRIIYDGDVEEAIRIYMGTVKESPTVVDLRELPRAEEHASGIVKMRTLEVLDTQNSVFEMDSKLRFKLTYFTEFDDLELHIRISFQYADGSPVTMIMTEKPFRSHKDREESVIFEVDTKKIVPGKYTMNIILYEINQFGTYRNCDGVKDAYCFEIAKNPQRMKNIEWSHRYWGHVMMDAVEIISEP